MQLTPKQLAFADAVIGGKDQTTAYRLAYRCPNFSPTNLRVEASRTAALPHVTAYISAAREKLAAKGLLTRERTLEVLCVIADGRDNQASTGDRIRALRLSAEIQGFLVNRQEVLHGVDAGGADTISRLLAIVRRSGAAP